MPFVHYKKEIPGMGECRRERERKREGRYIREGERRKRKAGGKHKDEGREGRCGEKEKKGYVT